MTEIDFEARHSNKVLFISALIFLLSLWASFDKKFLYNYGKTGQEQTVIGEITVTTEDIRRKQQSEYVWLPAAEKESVTNGDLIFSGKDSTAQIDLKNETSVFLESDSLILLDLDSANPQILVLRGLVRLRSKNRISLTINGILTEVPAGSDLTLWPAQNPTALLPTGYNETDLQLDAFNSPPAPQDALVVDLLPKPDLEDILAPDFTKIKIRHVASETQSELININPVSATKVTELASPENKPHYRLGAGALSETATQLGHTNYNSAFSASGYVADLEFQSQYFDTYGLKFNGDIKYKYLTTQSSSTSFFDYEFSLETRLPRSVLSFGASEFSAGLGLAQESMTFLTLSPSVKLSAIGNLYAKEFIRYMIPVLRKDTLELKLIMAQRTLDFPTTGYVSPELTYWTGQYGFTTSYIKRRSHNFIPDIGNLPVISDSSELQFKLNVKEIF